MARANLGQANGKNRRGGRRKALKENREILYDKLCDKLGHPSKARGETH
jgi:hypothetical protein